MHFIGTVHTVPVCAGSSIKSSEKVMRGEGASAAQISGDRESLGAVTVALIGQDPVAWPRTCAGLEIVVFA